MPTFVLPEQVRNVEVGQKMTGLNASLQGNESSLLEGRLALLVRKDPEMRRRRCHVKEWYVGPGLDEAPYSNLPRRLDRGWHRSAEQTLTGRGLKDVVIDMSDLSREFDGVRASIATFIPKKIYQSSNEVRVTPEPGSFKVSPNAPAVSGWCLLYYNGIFEAVDRNRLKSLKDQVPQLLAFTWINELASAGKIALYGDAGGQALQAYYPPEFAARALERGVDLTEDEQNEQDAYLWAHRIEPATLTQV